MSSTIDERVVSMRFDNKQFESAANESLSTLEKLGRVIDNTSSADNISKIAKSVDGINFGSAVAGVESLADHFSVLGIVAKRVLENITDTLMSKLSNAITSVTGSIVSGGIKRAMNIENAHFQLQGLLSDEKEVQAIMKDAMDSVDGTAYAYDEAAKAASMFAASGLKSGKEMQDALRAIAGVAATTNADYGDMSRIFTTVAGQGKVMADQLNQLAVRGMNGAAALAKYFNGVTDGTAEASEEVGKSIKEITKGMQVTEADIREFVHDSKISFNIFSEAMATTFGDHAKDANQTFTGALANIRAALARTGAMFVTPLINQNGKAVELFNAIRVKINEINKVLGPLAQDVTTVINRIIEGLTNVVKNLNIDPSWSWKLQRGFFVVVQAARGLMDIINPIKEAFRETFGEDISKTLSDLGDRIFQMSFHFRHSEEEIQNIKDGFKGLFDIIDLLIDGFMRLFGIISPTSDDLKTFGDVANNMFGDIGRGLSAFAKWVRESETINNIFDLMSEAVKKVTSVIKDLIVQIGDKTSSVFDGFGEKLKKLSSILDKLKNGGIQVIQGLWRMVTPFIDAIKKFGQEIWKVLTAIDPLEAFIAFCNGKFMAGISNSFGKLAETVTHVLVDTILVSISNFILGLQELMVSVKSFDSLIKGLKSLAEAILIMSGACFILASIDSSKLKTSMAVMTAFITELITAMAVIGELSDLKKLGIDLKEKAFESFYSLTEEIMNLAIAVGILAVACKVLASMSFEDLVKGLTAVTILLGELTIVGLIMSKRGVEKGLAKVGLTLLTMSASLLILTKAVKELGSLDLISLAKGVGAIGVLMLEMVAFTKLTDGANTRKAGFALIEMAAAIRILVGAIKELASMSLEELAKGLVSLGIAIAEMVIAFNLMPNNKSVSKAFAMIEFAAALVIMAKSLQMLADLSPSGLLNAVVTMGVVILEMVVALQLMPESKNISKAFAMIEFAAALVLISKALVPLAETDVDGLLAAVVAMGILLLEMVAVLAIMQKVKWANLDALAFIEMGAALVLISKSLEPLAQFDFSELLGAVVALGMVMFALTGVLAILSAIGPMALVGGIVAVALGVTANLLAAALITTAKALGMIKELKLSEAEKDMDAFLSFMAKLSLVLSLAGLLSPLINSFAISVAVIAASLSYAGTALAKSITEFTPALIKLGDAITKFNDVKCDNFVKNAGPIAGAIAKLGLALKAFGPLSKIGSSAFSEVADGISKLTGPLIRFSNIKDKSKLGDTFKQVAEGIKGFGKSLKGFGLLSGIGASALNEVADAVQKLAPALMLLSNVPGAKINSTMVALAAGFEKFGEALDEYDIFDIWDAQSITLFADAVKTLAEPLILLSDIPGAKINSTMIALGAGFESFAKSLQATPFWGVQGRSEALLNLCDGINRIAESIPKLNEIDSETLLSKMTTIGNGFKKFGEALETAPLFNSSGRASGITALCDSVHNLADGISYFMNTTSSFKDDIGTTLSSIGNAFKVFGEALSSAPLIGSSSRGEGIATLVSNISTLAKGVEDFASKDFSNFSFTTSKISGAFKSFGQALSEAPLIGADKRGEGIATLVNSLSTLAEGVKKFTEVANADNFDSVMNKIREAFIGFSEALDNTPWMFVGDRAGGIATVVSNVKTLAEGIGAFKDLDFNYIRLLQQLGVTLGDFGKAIDETPFWDNEGRAEAIVRVVDALSPLADSAIKMSGQDGAIAALQGFSSSISGLGNALSNNWGDVDIDMITSLEQVINVLKNISTINTNNLSAVNSTVLETIGWLKELCNLNMGSKMDAITNMITQFTNSIRNLSPTIVLVGKSFVDSWLSGIKQKFGDVTTTAYGLGNTFIRSLDSYKSKFLILGGNLISEFIKGMQNKREELARISNDLGNSIINSFKVLENQFYNVGQVLIERMISGIESNRENASSAGVNLGRVVIEALNNLDREFYNVGRHAVDGFIDGINDNKYKAISAGTSLGQAAYRAAQDALVVRSPSKKFAYLGKMSGQGLINGLLDQIKAVKNAGYSLGESSFDGLKNAIDSIYDYVDDYMNMNPTITPLVDISEIQKAMDETSRMFNNAISISTDNLSGMSNRFSNFTYNQNEQLSRSIGEQSKDNSDVVAAVASLKEDVISLKDAMTNIKMVLDTGTMVGAMTPMIDKELGVRKVYAGRGM